MPQKWVQPEEVQQPEPGKAQLLAETPDEPEGRLQESSCHTPKYGVVRKTLLEMKKTRAAKPTLHDAMAAQPVEEGPVQELPGDGLEAEVEHAVPADALL